MIISKSKHLAGLQCPRLLWHLLNAPDDVPEPGVTQQAIFDQGQEVGRLAQSMFPGGVSVEWGAGFRRTIQKTTELLICRKPIYEASFLHDPAYCRVDILSPAGENEWDIIEVKSSTSVKPEHIPDVAFQRYCLEGNDVRIRRCFLMHVNNMYIKQGEVDPGHLFTSEDITQEVQEVLPEIPEMLRQQEQMLGQDIPVVPIGPQCNAPYDCPLIDICWNFMPETAVSRLYRLGKRSFELIDTGIFDIKDIPDDFKLNEKQKIQVEATRSGETFLEPASLRKWLDRIKHPAAFLDFETINPAIPLLDGTRPYQQVPFQFSLHLAESPSDVGEYFWFLAEGVNEDYRADLVRDLSVIRVAESVVAFNAPFEQRIIRDLAELFPEEKWLTELNDRFIDLAEPFRQFWYYHPQQFGSYSIKAVAPAVINTSYNSLEISKGDMASVAFLRIATTDIPEEEREQVRNALKLYCWQDTKNMIQILEQLISMLN